MLNKMTTQQQLLGMDMLSGMKNSGIQTKFPWHLEGWQDVLTNTEEAFNASLMNSGQAGGILIWPIFFVQLWASVKDAQYKSKRVYESCQSMHVQNRNYTAMILCLYTI
uniref:Uncharacterized protein n=1 Tax=Anguilla anguilla TaxID=7936 RepID=A0A0E9X4S1_ANGAN